MMRIFFMISLCFLLSCNSTGDQDASLASQNNQVANNKPTKGPVDKTQLKSEIDAIEAKLMGMKVKSPNPRIAKELIEKSETFGTAFPDDPNTPTFLFRAAEVANSVGAHDVAIKLFTMIHRDHKAHEKAAPALFFQAFTFETYKKEKDNALKFYRKYLERYPDHELAESAEQLILNINKSDEELIREFEQRNKK